jgi:hypothetical protein
MATQRISIVKIGGVAGDAAAELLRKWAELRTSPSRTEWDAEQWPESVRQQIDSLSQSLRDNSLSPPIVHFVEWIDTWSMFDLFHSRFLPRESPTPLIVYGNRFEIYGYCLPDGDQFLNRLTKRTHQFSESKWFDTRLREAVDAWKELLDRSLIVVLREVTGGLVEDHDVVDSLAEMPTWLSQGDGCADGSP